MVRKNACFPLALLFLVASLQLWRPSTATAAQSLTTVQVFIDGRLVSLNPPAMIVAERVIVPLRGTFEAMGAAVSFMAPRTIIVMRGVRVVELEVGRRVARVDNRPVTLDVAPVTIAGRTFLPLRFVAEALDADVQFDRSSRTVHIFTSPEVAESLPAPLPAPQPTAQPVPDPIPPLPSPEIPPVPAPEPVRPPRPTVVFPLPGTSVGNPVAVQGVAAGAARVRVTISVPLVGIPIGSADASVLPIVGLFSASVSYPSLFRGLPLTISVIAIDSGGLESEPVTIIVRQG